MDLTRSRGGSIIHEPGCQMHGKGIPWLWAHDKSAKEITDTINELGTGIYECKTCQPLTRGTIAAQHTAALSTQNDHYTATPMQDDAGEGEK